MCSGHVSALLSDAHDKSNVFGHVVIRKAVGAMRTDGFPSCSKCFSDERCTRQGESDDALEKTIQEAFGETRTGPRFRIAALVSVVIDRCVHLPSAYCMRCCTLQVVFADSTRVVYLLLNPSSSSIRGVLGAGIKPLEFLGIKPLEFLGFYT